MIYYCNIIIWMEIEKSKVLIQFLLIFRQSRDVLFSLYARRLRGYTATVMRIQYNKHRVMRVERIALNLQLNHKLKGKIITVLEHKIRHFFFISRHVYTNVRRKSSSQMGQFRRFFNSMFANFVHATSASLFTLLNVKLFFWPNCCRFAAERNWIKKISLNVRNLGRFCKNR